MKTLIVLGATNIVLGFTSFIINKQVIKTRDSIQSNDVAITTKKGSLKFVKASTSVLATGSPYKKVLRSSRELKLSHFKCKLICSRPKIKTKALVKKIEIKPPVIIKTLMDSALKENINTIIEGKQANTEYAIKYAVALQKETGMDDYNYMQLIDKAEKLEMYAKQNGYSTEYGFLINMGMNSGKKRFFVIDLSSMVILERGVVSHGRGKKQFALEKAYSNEPGSNCTSLGIYEVGRSNTGKSGTAYNLLGLEQSNSNASKRSMVLHAMNTIPENEIDYPIFQSEGSPVISPAFFHKISSIIEKNAKPVLMWIFDTEKESELVNCR